MVLNWPVLLSLSSWLETVFLGASLPLPLEVLLPYQVSGSSLVP